MDQDLLQQAIPSEQFETNFYDINSLVCHRAWFSLFNFLIWFDVQDQIWEVCIVLMIAVIDGHGAFKCCLDSMMIWPPSLLSSRSSTFFTRFGAVVGRAIFGCSGKPNRAVVQWKTVQFQRKILHQRVQSHDRVSATSCFTTMAHHHNYDHHHFILFIF